MTLSRPRSRKPFAATSSRFPASWPRPQDARICRVACVWCEHPGMIIRRPGIMEENEQVTFPPLPRDRYSAAGHPLPDLPPHRRLPVRHDHRGPDRALPPGPSRNAWCRIPVADREDSAQLRCGCGSPDVQSVGAPRTGLPANRDRRGSGVCTVLPPRPWLGSHRARRS